MSQEDAKLASPCLWDSTDHVTFYVYLLKKGDYLASTCTEFRKIDMKGTKPGFKGKSWSEVITQAEGEIEEI